MANKKSQKKENPGRTMVMVVLIIVILLGGLYALNQKSITDSNDASNLSGIDLSSQPTLGNADAPVTIVEVGDFKCPVCKTFEDTQLQQIKSKYIDTGKAKFVFINFPFLSQTMGLADNDTLRASLYGEAIYAQNKEAFWDYYDAVYQNQGDEKEAWASESFLLDLVSKHVSGIDVEKLKSDVKDSAISAKVAEDLAIVDKARVTGTPTLFVNGKLIKSWSDFDEISNAVENAIGVEAE